MEAWFLILISLCISVLLNCLIVAKKSSKTQQLPPGPFTVPILGGILWLRKSFSELEPIIRNLHVRYGPMVTLRIGKHPAIFVANRDLAHKVLVQNGAVFADRPPALPISKIISCNQHNISSAFYGPTWRILRRNLTSEILNPSRVKSYSRARKWVLDILINRLISHSTTECGNVIPVVLIDHFQYAMFCLLVLMCFGDKLSETQIKEIENAQRHLLLGFSRFNMLNFWPTLGKIIFRKRWEEFWKLRRSQDDVLMPLIEARKRAKQERASKAKEDDVDTDDEFVVSYVDTLLDLELPEEKRKLEDGEMISLCSEFLNAGTDTTSTALQWIMANLVKYPHVQERVLAEIKGVVVGDGEKEVKEEDLHKLPYLKAVVLEGLRRHPPGHFVLPHAVTEDVVLDGYLVPKNGSLNFMVADMGWDPKVWEDPMAFKPERFLSGGGGEVFDITGNREIRMMPFGAGRRICPASGLAMLHLEYFVANLVWNFEWKAVGGDEVDLSEKQEFTVVMKYPLKAHLSPRF
ncbi:cytochrome P450 89A2-like [Corylus avellana]|uniref:cytochrome P450 89A2-like n=1 Tax=Corylus avellana TaxID=13451 RepID=UPI001E21A4FD|nr:cytochrome P450 89A2-like [Corylus avellana]